MRTKELLGVATTLAALIGCDTRITRTEQPDGYMLEREIPHEDGSHGKIVFVHQSAQNSDVIFYQNVLADTLERKEAEVIKEKGKLGFLFYKDFGCNGTVDYVIVATNCREMFDSIGIVGEILPVGSCTRPQLRSESGTEDLFKRADKQYAQLKKEFGVQ